MVDSAVHLMGAGPGASDRHRQDSCNADPASAGRIEANVATPFTTDVAALTLPPCLTTGAALWVNLSSKC